MVKRHQTFRARHKLLKDLPFYHRYRNRIQLICIVIPVLMMFGPPLYRFLGPMSPDAVNPRTEGDIRELKKKFLQRERSLLDNTCEYD